MVDGDALSFVRAAGFALLPADVGQTEFPLFPPKRGSRHEIRIEFPQLPFT